MKVVYVEAGKSPVVKEIGSELEDLQKAVGDGLIQAIYPFSEPVCLVCNDEGKLLGLEMNRPLLDEDGQPYDVVCGPFFICGIDDDEGEFVSLTDELANHFMMYYKNPWEFVRTPMGVACIELDNEEVN